LFEDVASVTASCKFSDCTHSNEPGCAVRAALESGALDERRLRNYEKLQREERRNSESIADARARAKSFGRMAKRVFEQKLKKREW
jgi:ribosome biogenesis GTPase